MKEETRKELLLLEDKNERIFQVMGSLKLLNYKVKTFVLKLGNIPEDDTELCLNLNRSFKEFYRDMQFFKEEHRRFVDLDLHIPSVDRFAMNVDRLFPKKDKETYTILEMRRISVYLYRMADLMLKELAIQKSENEEKIHAIHAKNGKYYFNRK